MRKLLFVFLSALLLTSCTFYEPQFRGIENFKLHGIEGRDVNFDLSAKVYNENSYAIKIKPSTLDIYVDDTYMGKVRMEKKVKMKRKSESILSSPFNLELTQGALLKAVGLAAKGQVTIRLKGKVKGGVFIFSKKIDVDESKTISGQDLKKFKP